MTRDRGAACGPYVCAIGAFDGVHRGHRALVASALRDARERGVRALAVTFAVDPAVVLDPEHAPKDLLPCDKRAEFLAQLGVDDVVVLPFDRAEAALPYERFVAERLGAIGRLVSLHCGADFRLGAQGAGTPETLAQLGAEQGFSVVVEPYMLSEGERVSATRIRELLAVGDLARANALLGREHTVYGSVEYGRGEGTAFGFPTANIVVPERTQLPAEGVYAGYVELAGTAWPAAINVGKPRSLGFAGEQGAPFMEANLIGFSGNAYGDEATVRFAEWLRAPKVFESLEELERTVLSNIDYVRQHYATYDGEGIVAV